MKYLLLSLLIALTVTYTIRNNIDLEDQLSELLAKKHNLQIAGLFGKDHPILKSHGSGITDS